MYAIIIWVVTLMCGIAPLGWVITDHVIEQRELKQREANVQSILNKYVRVAETVEESEWADYHADAYFEYLSEFDALFNSYETKWSKNGRLMIRQGNSGSYTFAKKG